MGLLLRVLSIVALIVCILSLVLAGSLYWQFEFGDCGENCEEGMAFVLTLPVLVLAGLTAALALGAHLVGKKVRSGADPE